jgi:hypothetical protein
LANLQKQNVYNSLAFDFIMDYGYPEKRKNRRDDKKKREKRAFKRGGRFRTVNISNNEAR